MGRLLFSISTPLSHQPPLFPITMRWFIFDKGNILLAPDGHIPASPECPIPLPPHFPLQPLPDFDNEPACAVQAPADTDLTTGNLRKEPLRSSFYLLTPAEYRMAGKARELLYWDSTSRFCSKCGAPMRRATDISKCCTACGREAWPALSIAIIVLIRRIAPSAQKEDEEVLLVHARNFAGNFHGLIAGFVETGENLEECLQREVMEETGLRVKNITYKASQPWPYPSGLMVGFFAEYAGGDLHLQDEELTCGGWFTRSNLPEIPGKMSLARQLIDMWMLEA